MTIIYSVSVTLWNDRSHFYFSSMHALHKISRISFLTGMFRRDHFTHNPSPVGASHHPTSWTHLLSDLQPDPDKPHVIIILSVVAEEFILKWDFSKNSFPTFKPPLSYMPAQTNANADAEKKKKIIPGNFVQGVLNRESHSNDNNNTVTHACLIWMMIWISFQKQHFLPFFYLLFSLLLPSVFYAPPCLYTKPVKGS